LFDEAAQWFADSNKVLLSNDIVNRARAKPCR
jgi:hypothetical protein